jgi:hypothetical protein
VSAAAPRLADARPQHALEVRKPSVGLCRPTAQTQSWVHAMQNRQAANTHQAAEATGDVQVHGRPCCIPTCDGRAVCGVRWRRQPLKQLPRLWQHLRQHAWLQWREAHQAGVVAAGARHQGVHLGRGKAGEQDGLAVESAAAAARHNPSNNTRLATICKLSGHQCPAATACQPYPVRHSTPAARLPGQPTAHLSAHSRTRIMSTPWPSRGMRFRASNTAGQGCRSRAALC